MKYSLHIAFLLLLGTVSFAQKKKALPPPIESLAKSSITPLVDYHEEYISFESVPVLTQDIESILHYPIKAKRDGLEGSVALSALIDTDGKVLKTDIGNYSDSIFIKPVKEAMKKAQFIPTKLYGVPTKLMTAISITFQLRNKPEIQIQYLPYSTAIMIKDGPAWATNQGFPISGYKAQAKPKLIDEIHQILEYPEELKQLKISGKVRFEVLLDTDGNIVGHHIEYSDNPFLEEPVKKAIEKMSFEKPISSSQYSYLVTFDGKSVSIR